VRPFAVRVSCLFLALSLIPGRALADTPADRGVRILEEMIRVIDRLLARTARADRPNGVPETVLFDGHTLGHWKRTEYAGGGDVRIEPDLDHDGPAIVVEAGATLSGIHWTGPVPRIDYEVSLEFMKIEGSDFACAVTVPVGDSYATLVLGGWGGGVVGISSIDGHDASENETTTYRSFAEGRWYRVRLQVTADRIRAWLDGKSVVDVDIRGRTISLRHGEISRSAPLGLASFQTRAAYRGIRLGPVTDSGSPPTVGQGANGA